MLSRTNSQYCVVTSWYLLTVLTTVMVIGVAFPTYHWNIVIARYDVIPGSIFQILIQMERTTSVAPCTKNKPWASCPAGSAGYIKSYWFALNVTDKRFIQPPSKFYFKRASPFKIFSFFSRSIRKTNSADLGKVPLVFQVMNIGLLNNCTTNISLLSYKFT